MESRKPRPVITIVSARPMSELNSSSSFLNAVPTTTTTKRSDDSNNNMIRGSENIVNNGPVFKQATVASTNAAAAVGNAAILSQSKPVKQGPTIIKPPRTFQTKPADVEVAARDSVVSPTAAPQLSIASPLSPTSAHMSAHEQSSAPPPASKKPFVAQKPAIAHKPAVMPKPSTVSAESVSNAAQHGDISRSVQPTKPKPTMIRSSSLRVVSGEASNTAQPAPHSRQDFDAHTTDTRMSVAPKPAAKPRLSIAGDMQATVSQLAEPNNVHWKPAKPSLAVIPAASHTSAVIPAASHTSVAIPAASHTPVAISAKPTSAVITAKPTPTLISAASHTPTVIPTGDDGGKCDVSSKKPPPPRPPNPASGKRMSVSEESQQQVNARPWSYTSQQPAKLSVDKPKPARPALPQRPEPGHPLYHYMMSGPRAIALYDYISQQPGDLSFKEGDVISLVQEVSAEWMKGRDSGGREGVFPVCFVNITHPLPASPVQHTVDNTLTGAYCIARFDYLAQEDGDLSFSAGDKIELVEVVNGEWLRGRKDHRVGIFPIEYVEIVQDKTDQNNTVNTHHSVIGQTSVSSISHDLPVSSMSYDLPVSSMSHDLPVSSMSHDLPVSKATSKSTAAPTPTTAAPEPCAEVLFDLDTGVAGDLVLHTGHTVYLTGIIDDQWLRGRVGHTEGIFPASYVRIIVPLH